MTISAEILKKTMSAATNTIKPTAVWGTTLKTMVAAHPVFFLAITGGAVVSLGSYYLVAEKVKERKLKKELVKSDTADLTEESEPV